jgi:hypothetical protein
LSKTLKGYGEREIVTMTYQGHKNYETFCISLWLNNDQGTYNFCGELADAAKETEHPRSTLADQLRDYTEEGNPLAEQATVYSDLLTQAIENADWFEIADGFLEE